MFYVADAPLMVLISLFCRLSGIWHEEVWNITCTYVPLCAPEGILVLFVCLDLLFFVFFVVPVCPISEDGRVAESRRLVF